MRLNYFKIFGIILLFLAGCRGEKNEKKTGYIAHRGSQIFYSVSGEGEPLFLAHAGYQDHKMWQPQIDEFTDRGFKVVAIDLLGHGLSKNGDSNYLIQDYIKACLDSLGIAKTSLIGLSLGGISVTDFALAFPEKVNKLILVSSVAVGYDKKYPIDTFTKKYLVELIAALKENEYPAAAEIFTRYWFDGIRTKYEPNDSARNFVYKTTFKSMQEHGWEKWAKFSQPPAITRLGELKMPVLIVHGDKDLPIIGEASKVLEKLIPSAKRVEIKNVAHMLNMEAPEEFNNIVLKFLKD